jgi:hypothetical protein
LFLSRSLKLNSLIYYQLTLILAMLRNNCSAGAYNIFYHLGAFFII